MCLHRVSGPAESFRRFELEARAAGNLRISTGLWVPPPAATSVFGGVGSWRSARAIVSAVNATSVAAASAKRKCSTGASENAFRSSDFGGGSSKNGCARNRSKAASSGFPDPAIRPQRPWMRQCASASDRREGRCRVRCPRRADRRPAGHVGQVRHPAQIQDDDRQFDAGGFRKRAVEHRHQRRPWPPAATSGARKSKATGIPSRRANSWPSPIWTVRRLSGRCSTV